MPSSPIVSVIIPTYNRAHLVGRAIRSVLAQTFRDFELIVVDDSSTDDTEDVIGSFADPRIRYLRHETNRGGATARNTGIRVACGEYIAFLDSDDEWLPEKLERQLSTFLDSDLRPLGVVRCGLFRLLQSRWTEANPIARGWLYETILSRKLDIVGPPTLLVKRQIEGKTLMFDESLPANQDWDYLLRLSAFCQIDSLPDPLLRVHREPGPHISNLVNNIVSCHMLIRKWEIELKRNPPALAHHHVRLAVLSFRAGKLKDARQHLWNAIQADPRDWTHYVHWAGSLVNGTSFKAALKLVPWRRDHIL